MNKLWTFGDSYAEYKAPARINWITILEDLLDRQAMPRALGGSSLQYTYYAVDKDIKSIDSNDIVIVMLTNLERQWLINSRPELGSYPMLVSHGGFKGAELAFYQNYYANSNDNLNTVLLKNFLMALAVQLQHLHVKPILFSSFPGHTESIINNIDIASLNIVTGNLDSISKFELADKTNIHKFRRDTRVNHMHYDNQVIFADKIFKFIKDGTPIVLDGFLADKVYVKDEMIYEK
jgi:hypothetical protein